MQTVMNKHREDPYGETSADTESTGSLIPIALVSAVLWAVIYWMVS